jgi:hypothetical protein
MGATNNGPPTMPYAKAATATQRMIKQHPPPDTWILFTRSRSQVWKLIDDAQGRLKLVRVAPT